MIDSPTVSVFTTLQRASPPMKGSELRAYRNELGLTQVQFATVLGVTEGTIKRWENDNLGIRNERAIRLAIVALREILAGRVAFVEPSAA